MITNENFYAVIAIKDKGVSLKNNGDLPGNCRYSRDAAFEAAEAQLKGDLNLKRVAICKVIEIVERIEPPIKARPPRSNSESDATSATETSVEDKQRNDIL